MNTLEFDRTYRVTVSDTNENGDGFVKLNGIAVFIHGLVTGDTADIRITERRKNYCLGECVSLIEPSAYRTAPVCENFRKCGGCSLCHVSYEFENDIKAETVKNALRRAKLPYDMVCATKYAPERVGYRNKIGLRYSKNDNAFGYYSPDAHELMRIDSCALCGGMINEIAEFTNRNIDLFGSTIPERIFIRESKHNHVISLYFGDKTDSAKRYAEAINEHFGGKAIVTFSGSGGEKIEDEYLGIRLRFASESFRQVNHAAAEILLETVAEYAVREKFTSALDLYCGSGMFGLMLAKRFPEASIFGVEIEEAAIRQARENSRMNSLTNISFKCADAASGGSDFITENGRDNIPELVVVDPPRAGLSAKMREVLKEYAPDRIIYVSCNPQTMARDAADLCTQGYTISAVTPVNMFPLTSHVECVVLMSRVPK